MQITFSLSDAAVLLTSLRHADLGCGQPQSVSPTDSTLQCQMWQQVLCSLLGELPNHATRAVSYVQLFMVDDAASATQESLDEIAAT